MTKIYSKRYNTLDYSQNNGTAYDVKKPTPINDGNYGTNYYTSTDYPYYSQYNTSDYKPTSSPYYSQDTSSNYDSSTDYYPYYDQYNYTDGYPYYSQYNRSDYFSSPGGHTYDHNNSTDAYPYYSQYNSSNYNSADDYPYYDQYSSTDAYPYYSQYNSSNYNSTDDYPYYDQYNSTDAYPHYNSTGEQNSFGDNSTLHHYNMVYDPVNPSSTDYNTTAERHYEPVQKDTLRQHSAEAQRSIATNEIPEYVPYDHYYPSYNDSDSDVFTNSQYRYEL